GKPTNSAYSAYSADALHPPSSARHGARECTIRTRRRSLDGPEVAPRIRGRRTDRGAPRCHRGGRQTWHRRNASTVNPQSTESRRRVPRRHDLGAEGPVGAGPVVMTKAENESRCGDSQWSRDIRIEKTHKALRQNGTK